jgi:iron complex outermembrane receptor protein
MKKSYVRPVTLAIASFTAVCAGAYAQTAAPNENADEQMLPTVTVNASSDASSAGLPPAYAGGQVARGGRVGMLGSQDIMDTPFNVTNYTQELIQNQQAASVADVLQNDPSVRVARGFGNFQQLYVVRGFPLYSDDMSYNGLYGLLPRQYLAAELLERVEVFRGANTFLNGAAPGGSGLGGAINVMPKRAPNEPLTQFTTGVESGGQAYFATDIARRFGPDQSTGVRFNAVRRDGDTAIDRESRELSALTVGLDYRSRNLRLSADAGYQDHQLTAVRPNVDIDQGFAVPAAPDASRNFAQPWTYSNERDTFGTVRGEFDLNSQVTAWAAAGIRRSDESSALSVPRIIDPAGNTSAYRFDYARNDDISTGEVGLRGKLRTGSVGHSLTASAATFSSKEHSAYGFSDFAGFAGNIYRPYDVAPPPANFFTGGSMVSPRLSLKTDTSSFAIADTMSFADDRVLVTLGARRQTIEQYSYNPDTGALTSGYDKSRTTPVAGIVFKPTKEVSLYANYIEGLVQGPVAGGTASNAGQVFEPYRTTQKEVGVKYDGGKLGGSLALFTASKPNGYQLGGPGTRFDVVGEQRNRGVELSVYGEPARGVRLLGGVTFLDAKQVRTAGGTFDGKDAIGVPGTQTNLGVEWDVPMVQRLTLTGRVVNTSSQYVDAGNTQKLPGWTRLDVGARYLTTVADKLVTIRARIDNLTDRNYWASVGGYPGQDYLVLGAPRTFVLSASVDF